MKTITLTILATALLSPFASAQKIARGEYFPQVTLPSVENGEPFVFNTLLGKKLMLHLFASW